MPRKPRFIVPDVPVHVVQRGRSREPVFYDDADYLVYLRRLKDASFLFLASQCPFVKVE